MDMARFRIIFNYLPFVCFLSVNIYMFVYVDKPKLFTYEPDTSADLSDDVLNRLSAWHENRLAEPLKDMKNLIDIKNFIYILKQPPCNRRIRALILIHSAPRNSKLRSLIRQTWGSICRSPKHSLMQLIFLMGIPKTAQDQLAIVEENDRYNDIVQGAFLDNYINMTYKHTMAFKWFLTNCHRAELLIKCDDDVYLSTMILHDLLKHFNELDAMDDINALDNQKKGNHQRHLLHHPRNLILCNSIEHNPVKRSYRAKWRTSYRNYAFSEFPQHCLGYVIIYSADVVYRLYTAAQYSRYFYIDDVHMTGLLAKRLNISIHNPRGYLLAQDMKNKRLRMLSHLIFAMHGVGYYRVYELWYMQTENRREELLTLMGFNP